MQLKKLVILMGLTFWPLSLIVTNTFPDLLTYITPAFLLVCSFLLYKSKSKFFIIPSLIIPLFAPKLALFPVIFSLIFFAFQKTRENLLFTLLTIVILIFSVSKFVGQTIYITDYEANQKVIRDTQLYDSIFIARTFHNKARVVFDKFTFNIFALTDPNNYFFGFHPRQIATNQNMAKFPFLGIIFVLFGAYYFKESKYKLFIITSLASSILALSFLTIFDRNDFIIFVPLSLIFVYGVNEFTKKFKYANVVFSILIAFAILELVRIVSI
jgi:hypothetical protein